jgi:hypothetical protein
MINVIVACVSCDAAGASRFRGALEARIRFNYRIVFPIWLHRTVQQPPRVEIEAFFSASGLPYRPTPKL